MCGRFSLFTPVDEVATQTATEPLSELTPFEPSWNVAPQTLVPVATQTGVHGENSVPRHFRLMRWGLRPSWAKPSHREPINARLETLEEKPMFRSAARHRRGFVPADGWYEWMTTPQGKTPWYHRRADGQPSLFAVVWEAWSGEDEHLESCVVLTRAANEDCKDVHDRMPVVLERNDLSSWLGEGVLPTAPETGTIERHPVDRAVNKVTEDHPGLVRPIPRLFDHEYGV